MAYIGKQPGIEVVSVNDLNDINTDNPSQDEILIYDSASGAYTSQSGQTFLGTYTTADLPEGSNLYYTTIRFDSDLQSATSIAAIRGYVSADGDLSYDSSTGVFSINVETVYTTANFDSDFNLSLDAAALNGTGLSYDSATNTLSITDTGVVAGTYGSSSTIPVFTVNAQGQIDSIGEASVAGVTGFAYDSASSTFTISTATGDSFGAVFTLDQYSTTDIAEGDNLYYTTARTESDVGNYLVSNSYATQTYVDSEINAVLAGAPAALDTLNELAAAINDDANFASSVTNSLGNKLNTSDFDSAFDTRLSTKSTGDIQEDGNLYYTKVRVDSDVAQGFSSRSTTNLAEGDNLYYTKVRVDSDVAQGFTDRSTSDVNEGSNLYYTKVRVDSDVAQGFTDRNTDNLAEGSNLYYTTARFDSDFNASLDGAALDGTGLSYNPTTNTLSITATGVDSAEHGSTTSIPVFTVNAQGQIVEITEVDVASLSGINYNTSTGTVTVTASNGDSFETSITLAPFSTTDLAEGDNLYYTTARADSDFDQRLTTKSTTDVSEGDNLYYTTARADSDFDNRLATKSTTDVTEGSNLYYTTARADSDAKNAVSATDAGGDGSFSYDAGTGAFTYTGPSASETRAHFSAGTGVTLDAGEIRIGQAVSTTSDVTFNDVTVNDISTGDITVNGYIDLDADSANPGYARGRMFYDSDNEAISYYNEASDVTVNLGQEFLLRVQNTSGEQINNGDAVYISGSETEHGHALVEKAKANSVTTLFAIGVATHDIPDGGHGYITQAGIVRGLNTSGFVAGAPLYVSADSDGKYTNTAPTYPNLTHSIGRAILIDSSEGTVLVGVGVSTVENVIVSQNVTVAGQATVPEINTNHIDFSGAEPSHLEGRVFYDSANGALAVYNDRSDITLQVGQEFYVRVYNNSGSEISNGTPVAFTGATGGVPTGAPADASDINLVQFIAGIATHDIANGSYGYVTKQGSVGGVDTSAFSIGQPVFIASGGGLTTTPPTTPNFAVRVGGVTDVDSDGRVFVDIVSQTSNTYRVTGDARVDGDFTVGGNLNLLGTQTVTQVANLQVTDNFVYLGAGDTVVTNFSGTGLDDATLKSYYEGDSNVTYYVRIKNTSGATDIIEWAFDSDFSSIQGFDSVSGPTEWDLGDDRTLIPLRYNIKIDFEAETGHDSGDRWYGDAAPVNVDLGIIGNYNTAEAPYTHAGFFRDASDQRFKIFNRYDPEVEGTVDTSDSSFEYATMAVNTVELMSGPNQSAGSFIGDLTGVADRAKILDSASRISLDGDLIGSVLFNGSQNVSLGAQIAAGSIVNADINATAGITDTKLATISTTGKVQNSATTATSSNTGSAIVARDTSGNFSANTITANLTGNVTGQVSRLDNWSTDNLLEGDSNLYYEKTRVDSDVAQGFTDRSTADLTEGSNLYYTKVRVDSDVAQGFTDRTTNDLVEGDNLYYTKARVDSDFDYNLSNKSTDDLAEGDNLYYTTARHDSDFNYSLSNTSTTSLSEGDNLYYTKVRVDSDVAQGFTDRTTTNLSEGDNLYYTKVRVDSDVAQGFTDRTTTDLNEGDNLYYTKVRVDSDVGSYLVNNSFATQTYVDNSISAVLDNAPDALDTLNELAAAINDDSNFAGTVTANLATKLNITAFDSAFDTALSGKSTTDISEGDNLYYTLARVDSDVRNGVGALDNGGDGSLTYNNATGIFTYTGPSATEVRAHFSAGVGIDLASGQIALDLSEITTSTSNADGDFFLVVDDGNNQKKLTKANIDLSGFNNDAGYVDSGEVVTSINTQVTKTFVESLGIEAGLDSAAVTGLVDSDYVASRAPSGVTTGKAIAMAIVFG